MKAFPTEHPLAGMMDLKSDGMDLRDYFAARYITNMGIPLNNERFLESAKSAYEWADAMMEARK